MNDQLDPPPSILQLVKDNPTADYQWKAWLNRLFEWLKDNMSKDFFFEVSSGNVNGHTSVIRVSHDSNIGTTHSTVGEGSGNIATWSTTADINTITSTSASDTHAIFIKGLDANYVEVEQTVTLTGQTAATLGTPLMRVNTVRNLTGTATLGVIYIWVSGGGSTAGVPTVTSAIRSSIRRVNGLSNERDTMSTYTVPSGKTGYIVFGKATVSDSKAMEILFRGRPAGGVFSTEHHIDIVADNYDYFFKLPLKILEKTDVEVLAKVGVGTAEVAANFDIILVDN